MTDVVRFRSGTVQWSAAVEQSTVHVVPGVVIVRVDARAVESVIGVEATLVRHIPSGDSLRLWHGRVVDVKPLGEHADVTIGDAS